MPTIAQIVSVDAPSQANPGDSVIVDVHLKNISAAYQYLAVTGQGTSITWQFDYLSVAPGETVVMRGVFTMPSQSVTVSVFSWYWDGAAWQFDDSRSLQISLAALPQPQFANFGITDYT